MCVKLGTIFGRVFSLLMVIDLIINTLYSIRFLHSIYLSIFSNQYRNERVEQT